MFDVKGSLEPMEHYGFLPREWFLSLRGPHISHFFAHFAGSLFEAFLESIHYDCLITRWAINGVKYVFYGGKDPISWIG